MNFLKKKIKEKIGRRNRSSMRIKKCRGKTNGYEIQTAFSQQLFEKQIELELEKYIKNKLNC